MELIISVSKLSSFLDCLSGSFILAQNCVSELLILNPEVQTNSLSAFPIDYQLIYNFNRTCQSLTSERKIAPADISDKPSIF
jgi:hypothetical protein